MPVRLLTDCHCQCTAFLRGHDQVPRALCRYLNPSHPVILKSDPKHVNCHWAKQWNAMYELVKGSLASRTPEMTKIMKQVDKDFP